MGQNQGWTLTESSLNNSLNIIKVTFNKSKKETLNSLNQSPKQFTKYYHHNHQYNYHHHAYHNHY